MSVFPSIMEKYEQQMLAQYTTLNFSSFGNHESVLLLRVTLGVSIIFIFSLHLCELICLFFSFRRVWVEVGLFTLRYTCILVPDSLHVGVRWYFFEYFLFYPTKTFFPNKKHKHSGINSESVMKKKLFVI